MTEETKTTTPAPETKPWYQSRTILSAVAGGILALLAAFRVAIPGIDTESVTELLYAIGSVGALVATVIGRVKAAKSITP